MYSGLNSFGIIVHSVQRGSVEERSRLVFKGMD